MAHPLQIIVTGDGEENHFSLKEENLSSIVDKIPAGTKVAIVSVVGAFRTGKSFLLNFFLRYLRNTLTDDTTQSWMVSEGAELTEGNMNEGWNMVEAEVPIRENSFAWRGGQERQTTGIWMWSEPFIRTTAASGEKLAVLLMDTQGMFDNETTMTLTAQIFGLSTLVSSFQIYNVDKRIQEDNLQHLALFSEYGRMALAPPDESEASHYHVPAPAPVAHEEIPILPPRPPVEGDLGNSSESSAEKSAAEGATAESTKVEAPAATAPVESTKSVAPAESTKSGRPTLTKGKSTLLTKQKSVKVVDEVKPFQRLQFLVRDWQNFDAEYEEGDSEEKFNVLRAEMDAYLTEVLRTRGQTDLQSTREQITRCFGKLDAFLLPHPGFAVTKKNFDGSISKIEPFFRALINKYVRGIFDDELEAKVINGRKLTGPELKTYFEVYVRMFQAGEKSFPKAMTMLDATAEANNRNAYDIAFAHYKAAMDKLAGPEKEFIKEIELQATHDELMSSTAEIFDEIATMGNVATIDKIRTQLATAVETERVRYFATNALRNPFKDVELYILPLIIAAASWFIATIVNATCSTDFCESTEDTFVNVYLFILFGIVVLAWRHIRGAFKYLAEVVPVLMAGAKNK